MAAHNRSLDSIIPFTNTNRKICQRAKVFCVFNSNAEVIYHEYFRNNDYSRFRSFWACLFSKHANFRKLLIIDIGRHGFFQGEGGTGETNFSTFSRGDHSSLNCLIFGHIYTKRSILAYFGKL